MKKKTWIFIVFVIWNLDLMEKLDNRFYTRVMVDEYVNLVIIDDFSCNLVSTYAVEKLGLLVIDHPCPYEMM